MKAEYIHPFLESARIVIEQVVNVRPTTGMAGIKDVVFMEKYIWIQIGLKGEIDGEVMFGLEEAAALRMVSAMMGGCAVTEIDEMTQSAISELGNMISGNASTMLYNQGIMIDITPPRIIRSAATSTLTARKALAIPLIMEHIGELDIQVIIL